MAHTSTTDETTAEKWLIRDRVALVRSMIDEVECHILLKESLPQALIQGIYDTIDSIETEILFRRQPLVQNQIGGCANGTAFSKSQGGQNILTVAISHKDNGLEVSLAANHESPGSQELGGQSVNKGSRPAVVDKQEVLDSLQDNIKAIQSVIMFRMNSSMPSKASTTSSMVSFSVLEEEMEILDGLLDHVMGSYEASNVEIGDVLETKIMALPTLLSVLFNTETREAAEEGSHIDDKAMMDMVVENQRRTNVLRDIEYIANHVKAVTRTIQGNERSGC